MEENGLMSAVLRSEASFVKDSTWPVHIQIHEDNNCTTCFSLTIEQASNFAEILTELPDLNTTLRFTSEQGHYCIARWFTNHLFQIIYENAIKKIYRTIYLPDDIAIDLCDEIIAILSTNSNFQTKTIATDQPDNVKKRTDDNLRGVF